MKAIYHIKTSLLALTAMVACTEFETLDESHNSIDNGLIQELSITGKDFIFDGETRSSVTIGESGASFTWDEDDVIGIFPDKGDQVSFAMDEGAGTHTATFSGGGWALKSSSTYAAYYPHVYENRDMTAIPVSYVGQTQNGNGNTDHIGAYDFMAAGVSTPENGAVAFDMQHLGALVQLTINVPEPSTLIKVVLNSTTEFTETGTIDLTSGTPTITAKNQSNTLEIVLEDITTTEANENVTVYFMTAPIDLTGSELSATVHFADETIRDVQITGKNLQAGRAYRLTAEIEKAIPNNQIWYTSSDGNIISTYNNSLFNVSVISNIYENGKGVITFDGELTEIKQSAFQSKTTLTEIVLPNSVTTISDLAFYGCTSLTNITLSDNLISIGQMAFYACRLLERILIPNSVITIDDYAFCGTHITNMTIPEGIIHLGPVFLDCHNLKEVTIPKGVKQLYATFGGCKALSTIYIQSSETELVMSFADCESIQNIYLATSVPPIIYDKGNDPSNGGLSRQTFASTIYSTCTLNVPKGSSEAYKAAYGWSNFTNIVEMDSEVKNPLVGTSWVWSEDPITWTFTFGEKEVIFDYLGEFSPEDISTEQYRSTYTYNSNTVSFTMSGWSDVVWIYTGTISGNTMHLVDSGTEKIDIYLTKKE